MPYGNDPTMADASTPRDAIVRTLMNIQNPPPGGVQAPPGGIPPAQTAPGQMTPQVGGMMGTMPQMQPAALGTTPPPGGPMGSIGGPYQPTMRLPGIAPRF